MELWYIDIVVDEDQVIFWFATYTIMNIYSLTKGEIKLQKIILIWMKNPAVVYPELLSIDIILVISCKQKDALHLEILINIHPKETSPQTLTPKHRHDPQNYREPSPCVSYNILLILSLN